MNKSKYLQIFNYLLEFSKLRTTTIRDIESSESNYPEILWLADIPKYETSDCITFPDYDADADYWLKVSKPRNEPLIPKLTIKDPLKEWVEEETLLDEIKKPQLKVSIVKNEVTLLLVDHNEIQEKFDEYIENQWLSDLGKYKLVLEEYKKLKAEYDKKNKVFKQLFKIYNKAQQFGEEFELVIGVGLLRFRANSESPQISRHIFTSKTEIIFETSQRESFIKVVFGTDSEIQIETDPIIDLPDQFESSDIIEAEQATIGFINNRNFRDNIFDKQMLDAIQIFADRISTDGTAIDDLERPREVAIKPTLYFAPALMLRKRNTRSVTAVFEKIILNLTNADELLNIPSLNDLIGDSDLVQSLMQSDEEKHDSNTLGAGISEDKTIYFPKKYNDEQIEIVDKLRKNSMVVVQGPPGTGKSHTIANLICHLLANGKKILVTAYKKRALEVLKEKLPGDFQNLAVNLLSGDATSIQDLESSVNAINDKIASTTDLEKFKREIQLLSGELKETKQKLAFTNQEYLKVKEQNTWKHRLNQNYIGTLSFVAEKIEQDSQAFSWYQDDFCDLNYNVLLKDIDKFVKLHDHHKIKDNSPLDLKLPTRDNLITPAKIREYKKVSDEFQRSAQSGIMHTIVSSNNLKETKSFLEELRQITLKIENLNLVFKQNIINDLPNRKSLWQERISKSKEVLSHFSDDRLLSFDKKFDVKYPTDKSWIQLNGDAETLLSHLKSGGSLSGIMFNIKKALLPKNIKEKLYFIEQVTVNGSPCDTIEEFENVIVDIRIKQEFEQLADFWKEPNVLASSNFEKVNFYNQLLTEYHELITCIESAAKFKLQIESSSSIVLPNLNISLIQHLIKDVDYSLLASHFREQTENIGVIRKALSSPYFHPITVVISSTISSLDSEIYEQNLLALDTLQREKDEYQIYKSLRDNLIVSVPTLIKEIMGNSSMVQHLPNLESAILYKHACTELSKLLQIDRGTMLIAELKQLEDREEKLISKIGADKAWLHVLEGLNSNSNLRRHLQAWVQAVKKIGKTGVGKRALKFRKEAQTQMEQCQESVPCWIMPLYKVAETIEPRQGMYDYVIIDEASQLGPDAIFLMYISKNIIIVGDDKQTSPEYVGVDPNLMTPYIKKHLAEIPFSTFYGTETSFFDHAKIFCDGMTVLREHFRCMPEIIEFCNKHFYAPEGKGLYPLKQYSENRLEPLMTVFCQSGFIDGSGSSITNQFEAEQIASQIAKLIKEEKYKNKTIGVIALQGNKQASVIDNLIVQKIGELEYKKRDIVCGNSASFQGDERDIMFLSLVTATNHLRRMPLTKPEDERRFNVAVSRAKEQIWLFHSIQLDNLSNTDDLRYKILDHFQNHRPQVIPSQKLIERKLGNQPEPFDSWFEVDVYNDIVAKGYKSIPQYEVAKGRYRLDLVVVLGNGKKIAIECDGDKFHAAEHLQNDMMRQKVLERTGWQFFRVRGGEYYSNRKKAMEPLWDLLTQNDIYSQPINFTIEPEINETEQENLEYSLMVYSDEVVQTYNSNVTFKQGDLFESKDQITIDFSDSQITWVNTLVKSADDVFNCPELLVFSSHQNVYKFHNQGYKDQTQLFEQIDFGQGEVPIYVTGTHDYSGFLLVAFENGKSAKIAFDGYKTEQNRKRLRNAYNAESNLIFIEHIEEDIDLVAVSSIKKLMLFNTAKINPVDSKVSKGVQVMISKDRSTMVGVKKLDEVQLQDAEYYRKNGLLSAVGFFLKPGDII
ncbi:AAA domain-containing protein [Dyadobacter sp. CY345]|uniref:AAA domain-containing protein n=1 Tax=Dyadobacter sp. CY345 TaxID=2909335 RepID=UPI001F1DD24E|nr:AAA domain-containing protein [Dyadobacter sp. CY345]MCF2446215.1 AAA domain-containing protein [Dyadobacter sp. CY345]